MSGTNPTGAPANPSTTTPRTHRNRRMAALPCRIWGDRRQRTSPWLCEQEAPNTRPGVAPIARRAHTIRQEDAPIPPSSAQPGFVVRCVVNRARALDTDCETEAVDCAAADRTQAVHLVRRDINQVARRHVAILVADGHDTAPGHHEVPLVRWMSVGEDRPTGCHLELIDQLYEAAVCNVLQLARMHQVPDRHRAVVLDLRL